VLEEAGEVPRTSMERITLEVPSRPVASAERSFCHISV
jgi:hypothetical protein